MSKITKSSNEQLNANGKRACFDDDDDAHEDNDAVVMPPVVSEGLGSLRTKSAARVLVRRIDKSERANDANANPKTRARREFQRQAVASDDAAMQAWLNDVTPHYVEEASKCANSVECWIVDRAPGYITAFLHPSSTTRRCPVDAVMFYAGAALAAHVTAQLAPTPGVVVVPFPSANLNQWAPVLLLMVPKNP